MTTVLIQAIHTKDMAIAGQDTVLVVMETAVVEGTIRYE